MAEGSWSPEGGWVSAYLARRIQDVLNPLQKLICEGHRLPEGDFRGVGEYALGLGGCWFAVPDVRNHVP